MKNTFKFGFIGAMALAAIAASAQNIPVTVNGQPIEFRGQGPVMSGSRVLVPLRGVLERMGATVMWDPSDQTVRAHRGDTTVRLRIGEETASVNGNPVKLDVPAQIIEGSTMVPLRFVGEALGEVVHWDARQEMVEINTGNDYDVPRDQTARRPERFTGDREITTETIDLASGTVIPVVLDDSLSSDRNASGDQFTTTVQGGSGLPRGTKIEGVVEGSRPRRGDRPGILELGFTQMEFPSGRSVPIDGTLIGLDSRYVRKHGDRLIASSNAPDRGVYAGYGAGAGLVLGIMGHRPIEGAAIGGLLGLGASYANSPAHNVHLRAGQSFGVRLRSDVTIER